MCTLRPSDVCRRWLFFSRLSDKQQGQGGRDTAETHYFHPGAVDRPVNSFPRPLSKELAESLTIAGLAPGLCSGFCESSQLMPNSQLSSSFNTFVCGLKEDGAVTSVPETYWVLNQHYCKAVLE